VKPYLQNNQIKRTTGIGQGVECLPSKSEDLSSNPNIVKSKTKETAKA
jgi:hypothetical protein